MLTSINGQISLWSRTYLLLYNWLQTRWSRKLASQLPESMTAIMANDRYKATIKGHNLHKFVAVKGLRSQGLLPCHLPDMYVSTQRQIGLDNIASGYLLSCVDNTFLHLWCYKSGFFFSQWTFIPCAFNGYRCEVPIFFTHPFTKVLNNILWTL